MSPPIFSLEGRFWRTGMPLAVALLIATTASASNGPRAAIFELGARLFVDESFSSSRGDFSTSCQSCHMTDQDPQGPRAHTDFLARSWFAWRSSDPRREHARNTPTLLDVADMGSLHVDGEFDSLEDLVAGTLTGRPMGWLPGEEAEAFEQIRGTLVADEGGDRHVPYRRLFFAAYDVDIAEIDPSEVVGLTVSSLVEYLRTFRTTRSSAYDAFIAANDLAAGPADDESADVYARRTLQRLDQLEETRALVLPEGFSVMSLGGMKVFLRTGGSGASTGGDAAGPASPHNAHQRLAVGNCVTCHVPPSFTDASFHNLGVSQIEYDGVHGEGSFAALAIPGSQQTSRPVERFRKAPTKKHPEQADLGYWNFADLEALDGEFGNDAEGRLARSIAAFKTPTLRNLAYTNPYMHNGDYPTVESVLYAMIAWSDLARQGDLRAADAELSRIELTDADIPALVAFLATLGERVVPGHPIPELPRPAHQGRYPRNYPRD